MKDLSKNIASKITGMRGRLYKYDTLTRDGEPIVLIFEDLLQNDLRTLIITCEMYKVITEKIGKTKLIRPRLDFKSKTFDIFKLIDETTKQKKELMAEMAIEMLKPKKKH